jgi:hypothetical protein
MLRFNREDEVRLFNSRNPDLVKLLVALSKLIDSVFKHAISGSKEELTVFLIGTRIVDDFDEILLLGSNGYGYAALQIFRSMFEKYVDAWYLHDNPSEITSFWNYHFVHLDKLKFDKVADELDPQWREIIRSFEDFDKKGRRKRHSWTRRNLTQRGKGEIFDRLLQTYRLANVFVHTSAAEILFSTRFESDGRISPEDNSFERQIADMTVTDSYFLVLETLRLQVEHYDWSDSWTDIESAYATFGDHLKNSSEEEQ